MEAGSGGPTEALAWETPGSSPIPRQPELALQSRETRNKDIVPPGLEVGWGAPLLLLKASLSKGLTWLLYESENWLPDLTPLSCNTSSAPPCLGRGGGRDWGLCTDTPTPKLLGKPGLLACGVRETPTLPLVSKRTTRHAFPKLQFPRLTSKIPTNSWVEALDLSSSLLSLTHNYHQSLLPQNLYVVNRSNGMLALPHPQGSETPPPCCFRAPPLPNISTALLPTELPLSQDTLLLDLSCQPGQSPRFPGILESTLTSPQNSGWPQSYMSSPPPPSFLGYFPSLIV